MVPEFCWQEPAARLGAPARVFMHSFRQKEIAKQLMDADTFG
jgi:hypothetical protein